MQKSDTGALGIRLFIRLLKIRLNSPSADRRSLFPLEKVLETNTVHSVNDHMSALISSLAELLFAFCALVWFLSTMDEHVSAYVIAE